MKPRPKPSTRRQMGDWVYLSPHSGFVGESDRLRAEIVQEAGEYAEGSCMLGCGDPKCVEWPTLWTEPDPECNGERHMLCHVSECQMWTHPAPFQHRVWRWRQTWYTPGRQRGNSAKTIARQKRKWAAIMAARTRPTT